MRLAIRQPVANRLFTRHHAAAKNYTTQFRSIYIRRPRSHQQPWKSLPRPSYDSVKPSQDQSRRTFFIDSLPSILVPPVVFTSLLLALWTYKCMMTVLFQDKIIYMPYMPPFARSEKMEEYTAVCRPVEWVQRHIKSMDGTKIALCIGRIPETSERVGRKKHVVVCYFQGNGSSLPPRLPLLSNILKAIQSQGAAKGNVQCTLVALSYRGYWTSSGRASQSGIEMDAQALLQWVQATYAQADSDLELVLWGQSIGAGVASTAAASYLEDKSTGKPPISGFILETPFSGIKSMLIALYPQKWLPYRYLWPFLWNHWDSEEALKRIATCGNRPEVLLLPATRDEVVPYGEADKLERLSCELGLPTQRKDIIGALHTEATVRREGQDAVARFVFECTSKA